MLCNNASAAQESQKQPATSKEERKSSNKEARPADPSVFIPYKLEKLVTIPFNPIAFCHPFEDRSAYRTRTFLKNPHGQTNAVVLA
jgi:hypothetical protein